MGAYKLRVKLFKSDGGSPSYASLPATTPVYNWAFSDTPSVNIYLKIDSLAEGNYWIYAYDNLDAADNWNTAITRTVYTVNHNSTPSYADVITLTGSSALFADSGTIKGKLTSAAASSYNYAELYYYNSAMTTSYFMGYFYCGSGSPGTLRIPGVPTLAEMAAYNSFTYDNTYDTYWFAFWNDVDANNRFSQGDLYYWNYIYSEGFLDIGDVKDSVDIGGIPLDSVYNGVAMGKKLAKRALFR
jgi:hypothetical protein